jgi:hypothetical protein
MCPSKDGLFFLKNLTKESVQPSFLGIAFVISNAFEFPFLYPAVRLWKTPLGKLDIGLF